jgi:dihydrofolate synthase/folylpolyglutamate synthase
VEPLAYLFSLESLGIKFGLENIRAICEALGHPERAWPSAVVAGTNGKGSVSAMVETGLRTAGLRTGLYTSPHLVRLEERFAIDGTPVATEDMAAAATTVRDAVAALRSAGRLATEPTFFEVTTALGFELFRRAHVDFVVLEVGLGGRFDATTAPPLSPRRSPPSISITSDSSATPSPPSPLKKPASSSRAWRSSSGRRSRPP